MSTAISESAAIQEHLPSQEKLRRDTLLYLTAGNAALLPTFARIRRGSFPAEKARGPSRSSSRRHLRRPEPHVSVERTSLDGEKGLRTPRASDLSDRANTTSSLTAAAVRACGGRSRSRRVEADEEEETRRRWRDMRRSGEE